MAEWLVSCGIDTVAMQSTGVYWIGLYDILESHGLKVVLANSRDTKNVPGRKTDVPESRWRLRGRHVQEATESIQHMQKALTKMNIQLANASRDVAGVTAHYSNTRPICRPVLWSVRMSRRLQKPRRVPTPPAWICNRSWSGSEGSI